MTLLRPQRTRTGDQRCPRPDPSAAPSERSPRPDRPDRVVVGVDDSPASQAALIFAVGQARRHGCPLEVVTAWPAATEEFVREVPGHVSAPRARAVHQQSVALRRVRPLATGVWIEAVVVNARPHEALIERCDEAALLVVGASRPGRHGGGRRRPVDDLVRVQAACPVVVVPESALPDASVEAAVVEAKTPGLEEQTEAASSPTPVHPGLRSRRDVSEGGLEPPRPNTGTSTSS